MKKKIKYFYLFLMLLFSVQLAAKYDVKSNYVIVVSKKTSEEWKEVVEALKTKHKAKVIVYKSNVAKTLTQLKAEFPRYTCFVAQKEEANRDFVAKIHRLTREFDSDPYTDTFWGILTGFNKENALTIAKQSAPLEVKKVAGGTQFAIDKCVEGFWHDELVKGKKVEKTKNKVTETIGDADSTKALVDSLNVYKADLFITSGHATPRNWQIGFRYKNGYFTSHNGVLTGEDTKKNKYKLASPNPKVYMPVGNCLMGCIDGPDAMALAWLNSAGVYQMFGYTVPSGYGFGGWGCLDYFVEQPGRYTFTEAFFANQHALIYRLQKYFPEVASMITPLGRYIRVATVVDNKIGLKPFDGTGLLYDRDVLAYYGDPAWVARMAKAPCSYGQSLTIKDNVYTFEIQPQLGDKSFDPVDTNGSQRGYRPIVEFLPYRLKDIKIIEGQDLKPVITDDFILIPNPRKCDPKMSYKIRFTASKIVKNK